MSQRSEAKRAYPRRTAPDPSFGRSVAGTVLGTALPGLGMILGRRKVVGALILTTFLIGLQFVIGSFIFNRQQTLALLLRPTTLFIVAIAMALVAVFWVGTIVLTHLWLRPRTASAGQRTAGGVLVMLLSFVIAAPLLVGSVYAATSASAFAGMFKSSAESKSATRPVVEEPSGPDPWAGTDRVNILLLGGDSDAGAREGVRTDTVMVASIDTQTGDTTLIGLPRNTARMPFPETSPMYQHFPNGFTNGNSDDANYFLNAMYDGVPAILGKDILGPTDNVGADVMKISVGEALGLRIDYYVLLDIQGFTQLIDALGGITVNINRPIPVGGSHQPYVAPKRYLDPGPNQHLNGTDAMWYARSRFDSDDFDRMERQQCVIDAMIKQVNPANVVSRYEAIAREGAQLVLTDIPQERVPAMVELSLRAKDGQVRSVVFKHQVQGFSSTHPDWDAVRARVAEALTEAQVPPTMTPTPPPSTTPGTPSTSPSSRTSKSPSATPTTASNSTVDSCSYQPQ